MLALVMCLLPFSAAADGWMGRGFYEPDTRQDQQGGFMYLEAPDDPNNAEARVYFNTYDSLFLVSGSFGLGAMKNSYQIYPTSMHAFLGVWKDCNYDGYIGHVEGALLEYRVELLDAKGKTICPEQTGQNDVHNDGEWVREFLWIGPNNIEFSGANKTAPPEDWNGDPDTDPRNTNNKTIDDNTSRIWGDFGLPEDEGIRSCPVNPRPRGTFQSTGGLLLYADCHANWVITKSITTAADMAGQDDLRWDNHRTDECAENEPVDENGECIDWTHPNDHDNTLNEPNPWGQSKDDAYVTAFDCSRPITFTDPTRVEETEDQEAQPGLLGPKVIRNPANNATLAYVNITDDEGERWITSTPQAPSGVNPNGSPAGTVNQTWTDAGRRDCTRDNNTAAVNSGNIYALLEGDLGASGAVRSQTNVWFAFYQGQTSPTLYSRGETRVNNSDLDMNETLVEEVSVAKPWGDTYDDMGIGLLPWITGVNDFQPFWFGEPGYVVSRNPYVNQDTTTFYGGVYMTFYAHVNATGEFFSVPGNEGRYGSDHCGPSGEVLTGAWVCDRDKWWKPNAAGNSDGRGLFNAYVGDTYNLRDIDCYDGTLFDGQPVTTSDIGRVCDRPVWPMP